MMEKNIQTLLFKSLIILIAVLCLGVLSWSYYNYRLGQNIIDPERSISFTAEGKVLAKPDIARLSFSVITQGEKAEQVQKENNEKTQKAIEFVKKKEVKQEDISTTQYNLTPLYDYDWCKKAGEIIYRSCPPKIIGYQLTQTIEAKIRDFNKINEIIGGLSEFGVNQISEVSFGIDDPEDYRNQARIEALKKIKNRARILARESGINLGRIINISESPNSYPFYRFAKTEELSTDAPGAAPAPLEPGTKEIIVTITVSYEIK